MRWIGDKDLKMWKMRTTAAEHSKQNWFTTAAQNVALRFILFGCVMSCMLVACSRSVSSCENENNERETRATENEQRQLRRLTCASGKVNKQRRLKCNFVSQFISTIWRNFSWISNSSRCHCCWCWWEKGRKRKCAIYGEEDKSIRDRQTIAFLAAIVLRRVVSFQSLAPPNTYVWNQNELRNLSRK